MMPRPLPDIYEPDSEGKIVISLRKVMSIISERAELRIAAETMADDILKLQGELDLLRTLVNTLQTRLDRASTGRVAV
jgi:hypothetical protein